MTETINVLHLGYSAIICFMMAFACSVTSMAQAIAVKSALESMARQPEIASDLRLSMIIGLAMIESLAIYCLLVSLIFLFVRW